MQAESSSFRDVTRGGQIVMHSMRMFGQVVKYALICSLIIFLLTFYGLFSCRATDYDTYIFREVIEAELRLVVHDNRIKQVIKQPNGGRIEIRAIDFVNSSKTKYHLKKCQKAFWSSLWQSLLIAGVSLAAFFYFLKIKGKAQNASTQVMGQQRVNNATLKKLLVKKKKASHFKIANVPLVQDSETQHILLAGTTGTGKTVCMQELMDQIRAQGQRAIVYDIEGSFIPTYYRPGKDVILNPLDERTPAWNIWQECRDAADFEAVAHSLMPLHLAGTDPFWIHASHTVFSSIASLLATSHQKQNKELIKSLFSEDCIEKILVALPAEVLVSSPMELMHIQNLLSKNNEKTALSTHCKSLAYLRDDTTGPLFSIRRWVEADSGDGWLFISSNAQKIEALKPLLSVWMDVAAKSILSLTPSFQRRIWCVLDELPSLHKLPSMMNVLSRGRKYGACFVGAIQDVHQLYAIYGRNEAESLTSLFNTKVFYRTQEPNSAAWMSKVMGGLELLEKKEGFSYGANDMRDGVSIHQERRREPVVKESEFLELDDLSAFLRLPGTWPITQLAFEVKERGYFQKALVPRELELKNGVDEIAPLKNEDPIAKNLDVEAAEGKEESAIETTEAEVLPLQEAVGIQEI